MIVTTRTFWKLGNGDPYDGGRFGVDVVNEIDGVKISSSTCRPPGAVDIDEAAFDALAAAFRATWDARAIGGAEWLADHEAEALALRQGAKGKLIGGQALTAAEAAAITGT